MRPALAASALAAALVHAFVLFGLDLDRPAEPLPPTLAPVVVSLVAAAPAAPNPSPAPPAPTLPAPPPPTPTPPRAKPEPTRERVARKPEARPAPAPVAPLAAAPTAESGATGGPSAPPGDARTAPTGPTQVSAVPRYRMAPAPEYPAVARRLRQEGIVLLAVEVSAQGRPTSVTIARSSGVASLDEAALRAVRRWRFDPARTAGVPVASRVEVPIRFSLSD